MLAVCKREFRSLFWNILGWLFIGITLAIFGLYYYVYNLSYGYPYVAYSLSAISFIFIITAPLLTMRVFSEEKRARTDQLLLTSPVSLWKIVVGKFLALAGVYTICIAVICVAPLVLSMFGEVPLLETYVAILGFWLYGLTCIAIGTFVSSLTESQMISAVLTFILVFLGYMMSSLCSLFSSTGNLLTTILGCYDLYTPLNDFFNGTFSITGILYYVTLIALALLLTCQVLQKRRWEVSRKMLSTSVFSTGFIALAVAAVVLINFGVSKIPTTYTELDATSQQLYSITQDTIDYLQTLEDDITIYVYVAKDSKDENVDKTLQKYKENSDHITVTYVDPESQPEFYSKYSDTDLNTNSLVVVCGDKYKVIDYGSSSYSYTDSQIYEYEVNYTSYSYEATGYDCEGQVTAALQYVTSDIETVVYELTGHSETSLSGDFAEVMDKKFITAKELNLLTVDEIPEDCETLLITAPESDLSEDDLGKIEDYLNGGGHVLLAFDYSSVSDLDHFRQLLADYNLTMTESLVGETDRSYYYQSPFYLLPYVESTDATYDISGNTSIFAPYCVGFTYEGTSSEEEDDTAAEDGYTAYLTTSDTAFAKSMENIQKERSTSEDQAATFSAEDGDQTGSFALACKVGTEGDGSLVVLGSAYLLSDSANSIVSGRNATFFNGLLNELVTIDETQSATVVIPVKDYSVSSVTVSEQTILVYGLLWGIFMPLLSIVLGIIVWARRRKK
jgi:ABC-2 type transport system permease protein